MRIAVVCNDTRGGVQPYVALALGLKRAGHDVRAVAPSDLAPMFSEVGLPVAPLSGSIQAVMRASDGAAERGAIASMRLASRELPRIIHAWTKETLEACEGVEVVIGGIGGMVIGLSVAEKVGARFVEAHLQPIGAPTDAYPGVLLPGVPRFLGGEPIATADGGEGEVLGSGRTTFIQACTGKTSNQDGGAMQSARLSC